MRIASLRRMMGLLAMAMLLEVALHAASSGYSGVVWEPSFTAAKARAQREGKPILLLHLFGRLDDEFC